MLCFLTFGINLLPGKYLFPTFGGTRFYFLGNRNYYLIPDTFFHFSRELHVSSSWEMTCDLVNNRFFEISYEESLLFQHKSTAPMIYILTFENNLLPGKYFSHFWENRFHLLGNLKITLYQINTFFHFWGTSCFLFWGNDM